MQYTPCFCLPFHRNCTAIPQARKLLSKYALKAFSSDPNKAILMTSDKSFTFNWLQSNASRTQLVLHSVGVQQCQVVAILMPRGPNLMAAVFGCVLHSAVFLLLDPTLPNKRIKLLIKEAKPAAVLCTLQTYEKTTDLSVSALLLDFEAIKDYTHTSIHFTGKPRNVAVDEIPKEMRVKEMFTCSEDVLYIIFTSGSTGKPKGICASAAGTLSRFEWMWKEYPFQPSDVICFKTSVSFVDCIWEIFGGILKAVPLMIASDAEVKDPRLLLDIIEKYCISRISLVPTYLEILLNCSSAVSHLETLRICGSSGEYLTKQLASKFLSGLPHCKLLNLYGTSEVCADVTCFEVTQEYLNQTNDVLVPIGKPIANVSVTVGQGNQMPNTVSEPGELTVYGDCVAHSYLNSSDSTLFQSDDKTCGFRTGDVVHYTESGDLMYAGRSNAEMKVRGIRINPAEVEALLQEHSCVEIAIVLPDERSVSLCAYVKINRSTELCSTAPATVRHADVDYFYDSALSETITAHAESVLPQQQVPSHFIFSHSLPQLPSGKVNRLQLPGSSVISQLYSAGLQQRSRMNSDTEEQLCSIFKDCLSLLEHACVSPTSTFISLGGHSLLAVEAARRVEDHFSCRVPVPIVLSTTIAELARYIESQQVNGQDHLDIMNLDVNEHTEIHYGIDEGPLSFQQEGMWVVQKIWYADAILVEIAALSSHPIRSECLRKAILQLTVNHDCLRTVIPCDSNGRPFQKVLTADCPEYGNSRSSVLTVTDCSKEPHCPVNFENGLIHLPKFDFNLAEGPLWRFLLFTNVHWPGSCSERDILALQIHHIITDGWSLQILFSELENKYDHLVRSDCGVTEQHASSKSSPLIQHALLQRSEIGSHLTTVAKLKYWETQLKNAAQCFSLIPDRLPSTTYFEGHTVLRDFDMPIHKVRQFCQSNEVTEFVFVFTSWVIANYALTGSEEFMVLLAVSTRTPGTAKVTGPLVQLQPLRTMVKPCTSLRSLFDYVRKTVMDLFNNELPLEYIEKHLMRTGKILQDATLVAEYPFKQIMFVYDQEESKEFSGSRMFEKIPVFTNQSENEMDIYVSMPKGKDKLFVKLVYPVGLFNPGKVSSLLETWHTVLQALLDDPQMDETVLLFCDNIFTPKVSGEFNYSAAVVGQSQTTSKMVRCNSTAITMKGDCISWCQLDIMKEYITNQLALISDLHRPPRVAILFPFSALAMATATAAVTCGCSIHFSTLAGYEASFAEQPPDLVVSSMKNMEDITDSRKEISSVTVVSAQSLLSQELPADTLSKKSLCMKQTTEGDLPDGGKDSLLRGSTQAYTEDNMPVLTERWQRDFTACLDIINNYFPELSNAAVFTCTESSTFSIAVSLLLKGVSLCILSRDDLSDTCSFVKLLEKRKVQLLIVPEAILPTVSCTVDFSSCKELSHMWVHGMPFGLAHLSLATANNVLPEVIVTHSLVPLECLVTHHFKLQDSVISESVKAQAAYLPLGVVCKGLAWKISHRDGRSVLPGFVGEFTVAAEGDNAVHHSGMLVRQLEEDGSFELVAFNADAYYRGQDIARAIAILSKVPEVVWCHTEMDLTEDNTRCQYAVMKNHAKTSLEAATLHEVISSKILPYVSQTFIARFLFQIPMPPPVTNRLLLDHKELHLLAKSTATELAQSDPMKTEVEADIVKKVTAVVSRVFEVDMEEVESCTDLVAIGSLSLSLLLDLTVELNKEFNAKLKISEVYSARNVQQLCHLVS